jgi:hypothetical protein
MISKIKLSDEMKNDNKIFWFKYTEKCIKESKNKKIKDYIYENTRGIKNSDK